MTPLIIMVFLLLGIFEEFCSDEAIARILGSSRGILALFVASVLGDVATGPAFIGITIAKFLVNNGASIAYAGAFICAWGLVSVLFLSMEISYLWSGRNAEDLASSLCHPRLGVMLSLFFEISGCIVLMVLDKRRISTQMDIP